MRCRIRMKRPRHHQARFGISKSAFKRALGKLMKDGLVTQKDSWTYMVNKEENSGSNE